MEPSAQPPPLVDEQLVRAAQRGDPAAMDTLVRTLMPYVSRVCGAIALDRGDDALQETFIAVLKNLRSLREPAALRGWVRRIAVRESIRVGRSGQTPLEPGTFDIEERLPDLAEVLDVREALSQLAPEQRAVLVLRDLEQLSEAEVAAVLNVPPGTVKSRLHRARGAFARRWQS